MLLFAFYRPQVPRFQEETGKGTRTERSSLGGVVCFSSGLLECLAQDTTFQPVLHHRRVWIPTERQKGATLEEYYRTPLTLALST